MQDEADLAVLLKYTFREVPDAASAAALALRGDRRAVDWMAYCLARHGKAHSPGFIERILDVLHPSAVRVFVTRLERENPALYRAALGVLPGADAVPQRRHSTPGTLSPEAKSLPDLAGSPFLQELFDNRAVVPV